MAERTDAAGRCECGVTLVLNEEGVAGAHRELRCRCGRRHDCEFREAGWTAVAHLEPERSVPLSGFSRDLRQAPDAERFRFSFPLRGDVPLPVHIVYSPSAKSAEVKSADLKVYRLENVESPAQARRFWVAWWRTRQRAPRSRGSSPLVPTRVGRLPPPVKRPGLAPAS
ncbi:MAG: hypothetical protein WEB59_03895 [Thermoanaerobaculia bacterium]